MSEDSKLLIVMIAGCATFMTLFMGGVVLLNRYSCGKLSQSTGIETRYVLLGGGCLVKVNDRFIPKENWRGEYEHN